MLFALVSLSIRTCMEREKMGRKVLVAPETGTDVGIWFFFSEPLTNLFVSVQAARARGVDCIVAPYEADAQLAYLSKTGMVQAIITEDSDLLAFGCKKVEKILCLISKLAVLGLKSAISKMKAQQRQQSRRWRSRRPGLILVPPNHG